MLLLLAKVAFTILYFVNKAIKIHFVERINHSGALKLDPNSHKLKFYLRTFYANECQYLTET